MRLFLSLALLAAAFVALDARATCTCECVESQERAVCGSLRDAIPVCNKSCPAAPWIPKPSDSKRAAPPGTYGCEPMRVYDRLANRHYWTELCVGSSRSGVALVRRGIPPMMPSPPLPSSSVASRPYRSAPPAYGGGPGCDTDSDCPMGSTCARRSTSDTWVCKPR
jgi:hypothetical protein